MWPIDALRRASHRRHYEAAWAVLLGRYTFSHLSSREQNEVSQRDDQYLLACGSSLPFIRHYLRRKFFPDYIIAMKSLGIRPALKNERWPVPNDLEMPYVDPATRFHFAPHGYHKVLRYASWLRRNFRYEDPATEEARKDLAARGIDVPAADPMSLEEVHHMGLDGRFVTWREWWRSHP